MNLFLLKLDCPILSYEFLRSHLNIALFIAFIPCLTLTVPSSLIHLSRDIGFRRMNMTWSFRQTGGGKSGQINFCEPLLTALAFFLTPPLGPQTASFYFFFVGVVTPDNSSACQFRRGIWADLPRIIFDLTGIWDLEPSCIILSPLPFVLFNKFIQGCESIIII